ncbi:carbonic anhydrase 13 [Ctenocephalides felis]|uniref:carbonic anhydrase 13 n=1 Tax=Ctenocephalides felis TaxID=7515 RepID=UPI000E6E147F|nr:carbonic anhydrase 13 [Ctenocephalides felis]
MNSWGYNAENGPSTWPHFFPEAAGSRQSPIDIQTSETKSEKSWDLLTYKYVPENTRSLVNPGYCWRVDVNGKGSELQGGPLHDVYSLEQFHCHWGCSDGRGSEHTVDGKSFSGELHLVHWNKNKYETFTEAAGMPDGLAVLGVFLKVGEKHEELDKLVKLLPYVMHKGDKVTIPGPLDPAKLIPENKKYWTYPGSLTTPPCSESVTWILFKEPIEVSHEQLEAFRSLRCYDVAEDCPCDDLHGGQVINNYRPPLPLGNRDIRECGRH